jgi:hypothetical protein
MLRLLLLIVLISSPATAQEVEGITDWKFLPEMSGTAPDGTSFRTYGTRIARGDDKVRLLMRFDFPDGAPRELQLNVPRGWDATSVVRFLGEIEFNCASLRVKPIGGTGTIVRFDGKRSKTKEPPFAISESHIFSQYFCERGSSPAGPPAMIMNTKPKVFIERSTY